MARTKLSRWLDPEVDSPPEVRKQAAEGIRQRRGRTGDPWAEFQRLATRQRVRFQMVKRSWVLAEGLYRALLDQVERRDAALTTAFRAKVEPIQREFDRRVEEQGFGDAIGFLTTALQALDLKNLRGRARARQKPDGRLLLARYEDLRRVLRPNRLRRIRNPAARFMRLREILGCHLRLADDQPPPPDTRIRQWADLGDEGIALRGAGYEVKLAPGTVRKIISRERQARKQRPGTCIVREDPTAPG